MDLLPLIEAYTRHLAEDLHRSPATVGGARAELGLLVRRSIPLDHDALAAHLSRLPDGRPLAASTRNRRLAILRGFVMFLVKRREIALSPLLGIRRAKLPRRTTQTVGTRDLSLIIAALLTDPASWRRTRDATLLLLFYYTGLRLAEVARLGAHQVDFAAGVLRSAVRKGGDTTDVVLHPCLATQLAAWMRARGDCASTSLFARANSRPLSPRSIQLRIARMGEKAGLTITLHPHALRHAHATGLLRVGVATAIIQQSMNHHALATTELYLHGDIEMVRAAVDKLPPLPVVGSRT